MISFNAFSSSDASVEREVEWSVDGMGSSSNGGDLENPGDTEVAVRDKLDFDPKRQDTDDDSWVAFESYSPKYGPDDVYNYIVSGAVEVTPTDSGSVSHGSADRSQHEHQTRETNCTNLRLMEGSFEISYETFLRELPFLTEQLEPYTECSQQSVCVKTEGKISDDGFPVAMIDHQIMSFMETKAPKMVLSPASFQALSDKDSHISFESTLASRSTLQRSRARSRSSSTKYAETTKCIRWWAHGRVWTCLAVSLAWAGSILSVFARQSVDFVKLASPLDVASAYYPLTTLGLIRIELCLNETASNATGCQMLVLGPTDVNDNMYEFARLFGSFSMLLGTFLTLFLTTSIFWETINLRPIGFGLLVTYFCQSFTMLFFDAQVCKVNDCSVGTGCLLSIGAACCWVASCITTATMESFKLRNLRLRRRQARWRYRKAMRAAEKKQVQESKDSLETQQTSSTSSDISQNPEDIEDPEGALAEAEETGPCEI